MTFSPLTTSTSGNGGQYSSRNGANIDRIILHHAASRSIFAVLDMMKYGTREVSSNYVIGNAGEIVGVVPEEYRAWTSGSTSWDGRSITFEIINETAGPEWRISVKAFDAVARMLADISKRYGIKLSRTTVITHQELYTIHDTSYATACPGPYLQARIDQLIAAAKAAGTSTPAVPEEEDEDMKPTCIAKVVKGNEVEVTIFNFDTGEEHVYGSTNTPSGISYNQNVALTYGCPPQVPVSYVSTGHYDKIKGENAATRKRLARG